jgi:hypothetical protein
MVSRAIYFIIARWQVQQTGNQGYFFSDLWATRLHNMSKKRFHSITEDDLKENRVRKFAKTTTTATKSIESLLRNYHASLTTSSTSNCYSSLSKEEMNCLLEKFYLACRNEKGEDYKASTLITMRQNMIRAIKEYQLLINHYI